MSEEKELKEVKVEEIKKSAEEKKCPVQRALFYIEGFLEGPMCGKCFPCEMGTYEARIRLEDIIQGRGSERDILALRRIAEVMRESSRCKKGKDTANFILEWMKSDAFEAHVAGRCRDMECTSFVEYRIIPEKCTMCGLCKDACKYDAIFGEKRKPFKGGYVPFEIRQKKCVKCGDCIKVCPEGAVILTATVTGNLVEV
jgi:NAD-dependent dihydropyrimidine dehydrogenase PreA subunit